MEGGGTPFTLVNGGGSGGWKDLWRVEGLVEDLMEGWRLVDGDGCSLGKRGGGCLFMRRRQGPRSSSRGKAMGAARVGNGAVWPCLILCGTVWPYFIIFGTVWPWLILCDTAWHCLALCVTIWYCLTLSGTICHYLVQFTTVWYCVALLGAVWHCLVLCGTVWYCMALFGTV